MMGFGGRREGEKSANHCFPLGHTATGACQGIGGLLHEYRWVRRSVRLAREMGGLGGWGPLTPACLVYLRVAQARPTFCSALRR